MSNPKLKVILVLAGVVFLVGSNDDHGEVVAMETSHRLSRCPRDERKWQKASKRLDCSDDVTYPKNRYHCLPIDSLSSLLEFCYNRTRVQVIKGQTLCMVYDEKMDILNHYNCSMFEKGYTDNWYMYYCDDIYKFPACFEIEPYQHGFKIEASCQPTSRLLTGVLDSTVSTLHNETSNSLTVDTNDGISNLRAILFGISMCLFIIGLVISIVVWKKRQNMRRCYKRQESIEAEINKSGIDYLLQELPMDKRTFPMIARKLEIPQEILYWNIQDRNKFVNSMKAGKISVYSGRVMVIGCAEAGKTTLVKKLKGDKDLKTVSTSGIEIHPHVFKLSANDTTITGCDEERNKGVLHMTPITLERSGVKKTETSLSVKEEVIADQYTETSHINGGVNDQERMYSQSYKPNHNVTVPVKRSQEAEQLSTKSEEQLATKPEEQSIIKPEEQLNPKSEQKVESRDCIPSVNENDLKMLSVLDFAGQSAYYACHHIFYSPRAFFVLVVDMTKKLDSRAIDACKTEDQDLIYGNWTYADYIRYWLGSIHTFSSKTAPVILVFSHAEHYDDKDVTKYYLEICRCLPEELRKHLTKNRVFAVKKESNNNIEELKKCIATTVKSQSHWGENVPISWTKLESVFNKMKKDNKIFDFSDLLRLVQRTKELSIKNDEELKTALTFFHETGVILFRSETEKIILDIQWFIDAFKCIILDEKHYGTSDAHNCDLFEQLNKHGLLSSKLLDELWKKHNIYEHKDSLIYHMKKLDMLAELSKVKWYVPCMNKQKYDEKYLDNCNVSSRLCFLFKYLPVFVYHRLIAACINRLEMQPWETAGKKRIFHTVTILSCKDLIHRILIGICDNKGPTDTEYPYSIEIQANVTKPDEIDTKLTSYLCRRIFKILDELTRPFFFGESSFHVGYRCKFGPFGGNQEGQIIKEEDMSGSKIHCNKCQSVHQEDVGRIRRFWEMKAIQCNEAKVEDMGSDKGILSNDGLIYIAHRLGTEWTLVVTHLGLKQVEIDQIRLDYPYMTITQTSIALQRWRDRRKGQADTTLLQQLFSALKSCERTDLLEEVQEKYNIADLKNIGSAKLEETEVDCSFPSEKGINEQSLKPRTGNISSSSNVEKGPIPANELEASAAGTSTDQSTGITVLQSCYVYLRRTLFRMNTNVIDELLECDVFTNEEKAYFRDINFDKAGSLLKRIIRKGSTVCRKAVSTLESLEYDIHRNIQQIIAQQVDIDTYPSLSLSSTFIKDHWSLFMEELEPTLIADYLFQYGVFNIDIHDEIEAKHLRIEKTELILHYVEREFSSCGPTFVHVLKICEQSFILSEIMKKENELPSIPQGVLPENAKITVTIKGDGSIDAEISDLVSEVKDPTKEGGVKVDDADAVAVHRIPGKAD